jgi:hypothetical protein
MTEEISTKESFNLDGKQNVTDSTKKLYLRNLRILNGNKEVINLDFLKDIDYILAKLEKYKPTTKRTYMISIVSCLKGNTHFKKEFDIYYALMMELNGELKNRTDKSETQVKNWMDQSEIQNVYDEIKNKVEPLFKKKSIDEREWEAILSFFILSLYTLQPPRRNKDYQLCKITKKYNESMSPEFNYLDLATNQFIFNNYKTKGSYGSVKQEIPIELQKVIKMYLKFYPNFKTEIKTTNPFLLIHFDNSCFSQSNIITRILNKIFGKNIGASMLRNIYLTSKYSDKEREMNNDAKAMGTSTATMQSNYIKTK